MDTNYIQQKIRELARYSSVYVPEFTFGSLRIDAIIIDIPHRWIRGFEIKTSRSDFLQDEKWMKYSRFCSSLSIVCPEGLIQPEEIRKPFGLLWIRNSGMSNFHWKKKPIKFNRRDSLAWLYTYLSVLEYEMPRMYYAG